MLAVGSPERERVDGLLFTVALCLLAAVVLYLATGFFYSYSSFTGAHLTTRDHLELVGERGANVVIATLVLGSVVALAALPSERQRRLRPFFAVAFVVGGAIAALSGFLVFDALTRHVSNPDPGFSVGFVRSSVGARLSVALPAVASLVVVLVAMFAANRFGNGDRRPRDRRFETGLDDVEVQDLSDD